MFRCQKSERIKLIINIFCSCWSWSFFIETMLIRLILSKKDFLRERSSKFIFVTKKYKMGALGNEKSHKIALLIEFSSTISSSFKFDTIFLFVGLSIISTSFLLILLTFLPDKDSLRSKSSPKIFWQLYRSNYCLQIGQLLFFLHHESMHSPWNKCLQMVNLTSLSRVMSLRQTEHTCKGAFTLPAGTRGMYWSKCAVDLISFYCYALYLIWSILLLR